MRVATRHLAAEEAPESYKVGGWAAGGWRGGLRGREGEEGEGKGEEGEGKGRARGKGREVRGRGEEAVLMLVNGWLQQRCCRLVRALL